LLRPVFSTCLEWNLPRANFSRCLPVPLLWSHPPSRIYEPLSERRFPGLLSVCFEGSSPMDRLPLPFLAFLDCFTMICGVLAFLRFFELGYSNCPLYLPGLRWIPFSLVLYSLSSENGELRKGSILLPHHPFSSPLPSSKDRSVWHRVVLLGRRPPPPLFFPAWNSPELRVLFLRFEDVCSGRLGVVLKLRSRRGVSLTRADLVQAFFFFFFSLFLPLCVGLLFR